MKQGFIKTAVSSIDVTVADTFANCDRIIEKIKEADKRGVNLLVLPELCLTGFTCGDLFFSSSLLDATKTALEKICKETEELYPITVIGLPFVFAGKLYDSAAVIHKGKILGIVPKKDVSGSSELHDQRQFSSSDLLGNGIYCATLGTHTFPFGAKLVFRSKELSDFCFGIEVGEDLSLPCPPSVEITGLGATIICNPAASDEIVGKKNYRRLMISSASARLKCGYLYANASETESTQDMVFSGHGIIAENGKIIAENNPFGKSSLLISEIDVNALSHERQRATALSYSPNSQIVEFSQEVRETELTLKIERNPFIPSSENEIKERAEEILCIQSYGLKKRIEHTHTKNVVIGISGGLDSTLALLVAVRTYDLLGYDRKNINAITMPCFGTTARTKSNAVKLCEELGVSIKEVNITSSVKQHFSDIGHDGKTLDVTFENSQARERTQVLMDIANQIGGLVIGTGDISELSLGWATYNGDHMSMYGINASVPKTLIRHIVRYEAQRSEKALSEVLFDILDTPVSPELLPADKDGKIAQKTEDLVGPYELHDFFLFYMVRYGFSPAKIFRLAKYVFNGDYSETTILYWLKTFVRRFFNQQFKRSCLPDGPRVGSVSLSPRGDLRMPSDASASVWLKELENL